ncbi:MAG: CYTH domain-containing protein [Methanobacteriota archaeon]|nr:MAG: CYTH domain-containing protein [Euryarchaeota archaeon]
MENIEMKWKLEDPVGLRGLLRQMDSIQSQYRHQQEDVYFQIPEGRLKLRLEDEKTPCLIQYDRPDEASPRVSEYSLRWLEQPEEVNQLFQTYQTITRVVKWRELYLFRNVRIHLDEVMELGWFAEFESVISDEYPPEVAKQNFEELYHQLSPYLGEPQSVSYLDLILLKKDMGKP